MDVRVLNYFLTVAQEESITRAADVLHTTQSNLSRQLSALESEVGKRLFERGNRKITLTEEGMFLRKRAAEIVGLVERTEAELSDFDAEATGIVHIGAAETRSMRLISKAMLTLRRRFPKLQFDLFSGSTIEVTEMLQKGLLDFGVLVGPVDMQQYDYVQLPEKDIFGLLMRKDHPLAGKAAIRSADIQGEPVIISHQQKDANVLSGWLGADARTLNIVSYFNLITTPAMMVEAGLGCAFSFDGLVHTGEGSQLCFRPLEPSVEAGLFLVWKRYQPFAKPAKLFLEEVRATMIQENNI
jgi:DNA-binding transcriptional LysR family regulator